MVNFWTPIPVNFWTPIDSDDRRFDVVELGEADLRVGVDESLLIDAAHALQRADIEGVLGTAVTGTGAGVSGISCMGHDDES